MKKYYLINIRGGHTSVWMLAYYLVLFNHDKAMLAVATTRYYDCNIIPQQIYFEKFKKQQAVCVSV